jgi:hypothetical protein
VGGRVILIGDDLLAAARYSPHLEHDGHTLTIRGTRDQCVFVLDRYDPDRKGWVAHLNTGQEDQ